MSNQIDSAEGEDWTLMAKMAKTAKTAKMEGRIDTVATRLLSCFLLIRSLAQRGRGLRGEARLRRSEARFHSDLYAPGKRRVSISHLQIPDLFS